MFLDIYKGALDSLKRQSGFTLLFEKRALDRGEPSGVGGAQAAGTPRPAARPGEGAARRGRIRGDGTGGPGAPGVRRALHVQHVVEIGDVADGEAQDLDLGELLVGGQGGQQLAQLGEGQVEGLHADPLTRGVRRAVLGRGAAPPALLLAAQRRRVQPGPAPAASLPAAAAAPALAAAALGGLRVGDAAAERLGVRAAQGLRVGGRRGGVVGVGSLVRAKHHLGGGGGAFPRQRSKESGSGPRPRPRDTGARRRAGTRAGTPGTCRSPRPAPGAGTARPGRGESRVGELRLLQRVLMRAITGINDTLIYPSLL